MNLLLLEDDLNLGKALVKLLQPDHAVAWLRTLSAARNHLQSNPVDLILLDLGLPDGDGTDWIRALRAEGNDLPVLILSARDELRDRILGLDSGGDDYLVKPFEVEELKARVRALLRRRPDAGAPRITMGNLSYESDSRQFFLHDQALCLTPKEHDILLLLIQAGGRPVCRETLNRRLGPDLTSNALEVHVHSLRKLLGRERIETVRGFGYRLTAS